MVSKTKKKVKNWERYFEHKYYNKGINIFNIYVGLINQYKKTNIPPVWIGRKNT